jgi:hypothetical protein
MRHFPAVLALAALSVACAGALARGSAAAVGSVALTAQSAPRSSPPHGAGPAVPRPDDAPGGWAAVVFRLVIILTMAGLLALAVILFFEDHFVFRPSRGPRGSWDPPAGAESCTFRTRDGLGLHGWWHPGEGAGDPSQRPVLLYCHGRSGNVTHRAEMLGRLAARGFGVFLFDYRGYGKSEGTPGEHGLCLDAEAAHRHLVEERHVSPRRIVCFGRSLGCTPALHVALVRRTAGLVMDGAFENVSAVVQHRLHGLPLALFVRNRFDNLERVRRLKVPLLVMHGSKDDMVPLGQAEAVFNAAPKPKEFCLIEGGGHGEASDPASEAYYEALRRFCDRCAGREPAATVSC